jgi:hypothetical protein
MHPLMFRSRSVNPIQTAPIAREAPMNCAGESAAWPKGTHVRSLARRKPGVQIPSPPPHNNPGHRPGGSLPPGRVAPDSPTGQQTGSKRARIRPTVTRSRPPARRRRPCPQSSAHHARHAYADRGYAARSGRETFLYELQGRPGSTRPGWLFAKLPGLRPGGTPLPYCQTDQLDLMSTHIP